MGVRGRPASPIDISAYLHVIMGCCKDELARDDAINQAALKGGGEAGWVGRSII